MQFQQGLNRCLEAVRMFSSSITVSDDVVSSEVVVTFDVVVSDDVSASLPQPAKAVY